MTCNECPLARRMREFFENKIKEYGIEYVHSSVYELQNQAEDEVEYHHKGSHYAAFRKAWNQIVEPAWAHERYVEAACSMLRQNIQEKGIYWVYENEKELTKSLSWRVFGAFIHAWEQVVIPAWEAKLEELEEAILAHVEESPCMMKELWHFARIIAPKKTPYKAVKDTLTKLLNDEQIHCFGVYAADKNTYTGKRPSDQTDGLRFYESEDLVFPGSYTERAKDLYNHVWEVQAEKAKALSKELETCKQELEEYKQKLECVKSAVCESTR